MNYVIRDMREKKPLNWPLFLFIFAAIVMRLYILYFPISFFGYIVPPGEDPVNHYKFIESILAGNFNTGYPWLFHLIAAMASKVSGLSIIDTLKYITPAMVVLPSLAIYLFLKRNFSTISALIGFIIVLWASNYALLAYGDGNYPNILAGGFFLPLTLLFLVLSLKERKLSNYIWTGVFALLTLLTHHLSAAYLLVIIAVYLIVLGIYNRFDKIAKNYSRVAIFILILFGLSLLITSLFSFREMFIQAYQSIVQSGSFNAGAGFATPIDYADYGSQIGPFVYYGGLLGIIFLIHLLGRQDEKTNKPAIILILVWFVIAFIFSRMSQVGLPGRFARELAIPLVLAESIMVWRFFVAMSTNIQRALALFVLGLIVVFEMAQVNGGVFRSPYFFEKMIWFDKNDKKAADTITTLTKEDAIIIANPTSPYLPIFAKRKIVFPPLEKTKSRAALLRYAEATGATYAVISGKTSANPSETYLFFSNFGKITDNLKSGVKDCRLIETDDPEILIYDLTDCTTQGEKMVSQTQQ